MLSVMSSSLNRAREFFKDPTHRAFSYMTLGQTITQVIPAPPVVRLVRAVANVTFYKFGMDLERAQQYPYAIKWLFIPLAAGYFDAIWSQNDSIILGTFTCFGYVCSSIAAMNLHPVRQPEL